jgi:hypothetical protein
MSASPTFVARFVDGEVTRMTTHCTPRRLDAAQGMRLSVGAYEIRVRNRRRGAIACTIELCKLDEDELENAA